MVSSHDVRSCPSCGIAQPHENRFCGACGARLEAEASQPSPPPARSLRPARSIPESYTPNHVVAQLLSRPDFIEGERKNITTLFVDVKGSMEIVEQIDPEQWHRILDGFFRLMGEGVHQFGGTINQYLGDGIMALFGAPVSHEDHAQRACWCALRLREAVRGYARELKRECGVDFLVRMGISTGDVVVGSIGDRLRTDYTAQGRTVGIGARLMQLAPPDSIYLAAETYAIVKDYFAIDVLGTFDVKGVRDEIHVFQLMGDGDTQTRFDASRKRGLSPFIGREKELRVLRECLDAVRSGTGRVLGLSGEAGIGKSRLFYEFTEICRAADVRVLKGQAGARGAEVILQPLLQAAQDYFGIEAGDDPDLVRQKIAGRALLGDDSAREDLPLLFDFFGVRDSRFPPQIVDPIARQRKIVATIERYLHRDDGDRTTVTIVEDLHWADEASVDFLERWVEAIADTRFLLLVNFRPGFQPTWMDSPVYQQIVLHPLSDDESERLARALLGAHPSVGELARAVAVRSGGNAFFLEEIIQTLVDSGRLRGERGRFEATSPILFLPVPDTVRDTVAARIDRLDPEAKRVLQAAAALGKNCDAETLREVVRSDTPALLTNLDTLQDARLLIAEEIYPLARFGFAHPLTREVALDSQLASRLQVLHRRIAEVLTARTEDGKEVDPGEIASHWEACGEKSIAAIWHATAAARTGAYNSGTAVLHWRRVLDLADASAADLRLSACRSLIWLGPETDVADDEAERIFEEGLKLARSQRDLTAMTQLFDGYASLRANRGNIEKALSYSLAANQIAERLGDPQLIVAMRTQHAVRNSFAGRIRENIPWVERALAEATTHRRDDREIGPDDPYTILIFQRALLAMWSGQLERARQELSRVLRLGQGHGARAIVGWAHAFFPELAWFSGEDEAALEHARLSRQIAERVGSRNSLVISSRALGIAHILARNWGDAVSVLEDAVELVRGQGTLLQFESDLVAHLGAAQLGAGDLDAAIASAEQAIEIGMRQRTLLQEIRALVVAAYARLVRGGPGLEDAVREIAAARQVVESCGATVFEPVIVELDGHLALRRGDVPAFESAVDRASELYRRIGAEAHVRRLAEHRHG